VKNNLISELLGGFTVGAHRGASMEFPGNTIEAFDRAVEISEKCLLEMDVRGTCDNEIIVFHDDLLEMTTDGSGPPGKFPLKELLDLDAGYNITFDHGETYPFRGRGHRIAAFSEVLKRYPGFLMSVDIKDNDTGFATRVIAMIEEHNAAGRVIVGSFHQGITAMVKNEFPWITTALSSREAAWFVFPGRLIPSSRAGYCNRVMMVPEIIGPGGPEFNGKGMGRGIRIITGAMVRRAHRAGLPVFAWTSNRPENMERLISLGIDGIVTDYPQRCVEVHELTAGTFLTGPQGTQRP